MHRERIDPISIVGVDQLVEVSGGAQELFGRVAQDLLDLGADEREPAVPRLSLDHLGPEEARETVHQGAQLRTLRLEPIPLDRRGGDIDQGADEAPGGPVGVPLDTSPDGQHGQHSAVLRDHSERPLPGSPGLTRSACFQQDLRPIVGMDVTEPRVQVGDERLHRFADELGDLPAHVEEPYRWILVRRRFEDVSHGGARVEQLAELLLQGFGLLARGDVEEHALEEARLTLRVSGQHRGMVRYPHHVTVLGKEPVLLGER